MAARATKPDPLKDSLSQYYQKWDKFDVDSESDDAPATVDEAIGAATARAAAAQLDASSRAAVEQGGHPGLGGQQDVAGWLQNLKAEKLAEAKTAKRPTGSSDALDWVEDLPANRVPLRYAHALTKALDKREWLNKLMFVQLALGLVVQLLDGRIRTASRGEFGALDNSFGMFDSRIMEGHLTEYGPDGRWYWGQYLLFDFVYIVFNLLFWTTTSVRVAKVAFAAQSPMNYIAVLPLVVALFDVLENSFGLMVLLAYPGRKFLIVGAYTVCLKMKWVTWTVFMVPTIIGVGLIFVGKVVSTYDSRKQDADVAAAAVAELRKKTT